MNRRLHHLNFLVKDLDQASRAVAGLCGVQPGPVEELPQRGVKLVRFRVGETWIILLEPTDREKEPGRHMEQHGEGFFLASFEVDDLEGALEALEASDTAAASSPIRYGLDDWRVADIDLNALPGVIFQLVEAGGKSD